MGRKLGHRDMWLPSSRAVLSLMQSLGGNSGKWLWWPIYVPGGVWFHSKVLLILQKLSQGHSLWEQLTFSYDVLATCMSDFLKSLLLLGLNSCTSCSGIHISWWIGFAALNKTCEITWGWMFINVVFLPFRTLKRMMAELFGCELSSHLMMILHN